MKISVIIPTYKPQDYIWECLDSLNNQTFSKEYFEVIIILNGCNDPYLKQINDYIVIHKINNFILKQADTPGVSNARNIALDIAKGEYICFIDDDDWVSHNYLEELYKHAKPDVIPLCRPLSFLDGTTNYNPYYITKDYDHFHTEGRVSFTLPQRFFNGPVYKLIHRDVIGTRRFDVRFKNGEDSLFMFLCSDRFKWVEFAESSCVYYRRFRHESASMRKKSIWRRIKNCTKLNITRTHIYVYSFKRYNLRFYLRQVAGCFASIVLDN